MNLNKSNKNEQETVKINGSNAQNQQFRQKGSVTCAEKCHWSVFEKVSFENVASAYL